MNASLVDDRGEPSSFFFSLLEQLKTREPSEGWQLIILDPASRFAGAETEKDNAVATAFIACLEKISQSLKGNPTILLAHHKSKAGTRDSSGQADARGSSALTDGSRWQANLIKDPDDPMITTFDLTKTNFTPPIQKFQMKKRFDGIPEFHQWVKKND
jgi:RecA-family ATPase